MTMFTTSYHHPSGGVIISRETADNILSKIEIVKEFPSTADGEYLYFTHFTISGPAPIIKNWEPLIYGEKAINYSGMFRIKQENL
jgi:hypothetical protein